MKRRVPPGAPAKKYNFLTRPITAIIRAFNPPDDRPIVALPDLRSAPISERPDVRPLKNVKFIGRAGSLPGGRPIMRPQINGSYQYRKAPDVRQIPSDICQTLASRGDRCRGQTPSEPPLTDSLPCRRGPDMATPVPPTSAPCCCPRHCHNRPPRPHSPTWPPPHCSRGPVSGRHVTR
jgi:hypothetical protein